VDVISLGCACFLFGLVGRGRHEKRQKDRNGAGSFPILAALIGVIAMLSAVQKADHGISDMPANADSVKN
jgi:hypothetical protein